MKVKELMTWLQQFDPEMEVWTETKVTPATEVRYVEEGVSPKSCDKRVVWLG